MSTQPFGKYQLIRKLATGGMAEVWLARQTGIEDFSRHVVIKRILPHLAEDAEFVQMFLNEAKIAARFSHANIAQIFDLGREHGSYFIAMEYVHGEDLGRIMRKAWSAGQWLTKPLAIRIIANACEGLYYAHSRIDEASGKPLKVVHRDVSPQNILVSFEGSVKLVDFGIAKAADQASLTRSGAIKGKFAYMSPEQASGKTLDHRSDIFALGLVLYELLTGVRPIKRENDLATLQAALECAIEPPSAISDVPAELDPVVMRALAKSPEDRYRDARQFQVALEEVLVAQRWVATSVQISELMTTLFADRLVEEAKQDAQADEEVLEVDEVSAHTGLPTQLEKPVSEWDAPPAKAKGGRTTSSRPDLPAVAANGSDPEWEAPPGEMERPSPRRRLNTRGVGGIRSHAVDNTPKPGGEDEEEDDATNFNPEPPKIDRHRTRLAPAEDPEETSPRPPTGAIPAPSRRATPEPAREVSPIRWRSPGGGISRKPAERARADAIALEQSPLEPDARLSALPALAEDESLPDSVDDYVNIEEMRERSRQRYQTLMYTSIGIAAVLLIFLFKQSLVEVLTSKPIDAQGVLLSVTSSEPVEVFVRHPESGPNGTLTPLGPTPLHERAGAHLQDVVILENKQRGIHYEEELRYGSPGQIKTINKEFQYGSFVPRLNPSNTGGIGIYYGNQEIGRYQPNKAISIVEGEYKLELRGPKLKQPVPFEVKVVPNKKVDTAVIDIRDALQ